MKNRFRFATGLALAGQLSVAATLVAQDPAPASPQPATPVITGEKPAVGYRDRVEVMREQLGLSKEQVAKMKPITERDRAKFKEVAEDKSLSEEDRKAKISEITKASREELWQMLTPEQQEKSKALAAKRKAEREQAQ